MALILAGSAVFAEDMRTFTDTQGRSMEATVLNCDEQNVTIQRADGQEFTFPVTRLCEADRAYLQTYMQKKMEEAIAADERLRPGNSFFVLMPELAGVNGGHVPQFGVRIPEAYDAAKPTPLLVWFADGRGSSWTDLPAELVNQERFLIVALPYPRNRLPEVAVEEGDIEQFLELHTAMLKRVAEIVPNIDQNIRIVGGNGSGAHVVGSALDMEWSLFVDNFNAFILHEGGVSPHMRYRGADRKLVLVSYGEKSERMASQQRINAAMQESHAKLDLMGLKDSDRMLDDVGKKAIHDWIDNVAVPILSDSR